MWSATPLRRGGSSAPATAAPPVGPRRAIGSGRSRLVRGSGHGSGGGRGRPAGLPVQLAAGCAARRRSGPWGSLEIGHVVSHLERAFSITVLGDVSFTAEPGRRRSLVIEETLR